MLQLTEILPSVTNGAQPNITEFLNILQNLQRQSSYFEVLMRFLRRAEKLSHSYQ